MSSRSSVVHGLKNGFVAGLWAIIPGILVIINSDDSFDLDDLFETAMFIFIFPVILCICCLISSLAFITAKDSFFSVITCGVSGMFFMNILLQLFYIISYEINDINVELQVSDLVNLQQLFIGFLIGVFTIFIIGANRNNIIYVYTK